MKKRIKIFFGMSSVMLLVCTTGSANLLSNGGFENQDGADSWNAAEWNQGGDQGRKDWAAEWGGWGFAFYGWASNGTGFVEQQVTCDTNAVYYYRIRGKRETNFSSGEVDMRLRFFEDDTNWVLRAAYTNDSLNISSPTNWMTYEIEAAAPTNCGIVQVRCDFSGANNPDAANRAFKWDNATLYDRRKHYRDAEIVDEFSYDPDFDDGISDKGRGHGFSDAWSNLWGHVDVADDSFPVVTGYPKPYGNKLHVWNTGGAAYRRFSAVTGGMLYVASYFNYGNESTNNWAGISLLSNTVERVFFGGNSYSQPKMKLAIDSFGGARADSAYELNSGMGQDYILIGRYDFDTHEFSTKAYYKTNSLPLLEPSNWDLTITLPADRIYSLDGVRLACGGANPGDVYFDEVRVAENWFDLLNNDEPPPVGMVFYVK
jgi:hypothetical protein